ncbi:MAG: DUF2142 domain-containing protein [Promethearchaeota archaeon]
MHRARSANHQRLSHTTKPPTECLKGSHLADRLPKTAVALLLLLTVARGVIYAVVIPPWQAPDEPSHFAYVQFLRQNHCLPSFQRIPASDGILTSMSRYGFWRLRSHLLGPTDPTEDRELRVASKHPPLYYLLATVLLTPLRSADIICQLCVLRLASVAMGALTVLLAYQTAKMLFSDNPWLPLAVASFIALLPMHTFMSASVNNDSLAELLASGLIYLLIGILRGGVSPSKGVGVALLLGGAYLTKRTTLYAVPLAVLTVPIYFWARSIPVDHGPTSQDRPRILLSTARSVAHNLSCKRKPLTKVGLVVLGCVTCVVLLGVVISQQHRQESSIGSGLESKPAQHPASTPLADERVAQQPPCLRISLSAISGYVRMSPTHLDTALLPMDRWPYPAGSYVVFGLLTFASFWANFGWMNVPLDPAWYALLAVISLFAFFGLLLRIVREISSSGEHTLLSCRWQKGALAVLILAVGLIFVQTFGLMVIQNIPQQGRYLLPAIVPLSTLFILGLSEFVPTRYRHGLPLICVLSLFLFDALCLVGYILPHFYG